MTPINWIYEKNFAFVKLTLPLCQYCVNGETKGKSGLVF